MVSTVQTLQVLQAVPRRGPFSRIYFNLVSYTVATESLQGATVSVRHALPRTTSAPEHDAGARIRVQ